MQIGGIVLFTWYQHSVACIYLLGRGCRKADKLGWPLHSHFCSSSINLAGNFNQLWQILPGEGSSLKTIPYQITALFHKSGEEKKLGLKKGKKETKLLIKLGSESIRKHQCGVCGGCAQNLEPGSLCLCSNAIVWLRVWLKSHVSLKLHLLLWSKWEWQELLCLSSHNELKSTSEVQMVIILHGTHCCA